jgi:putative DNA primase/helicase
MAIAAEFYSRLGMGLVALDDPADPKRPRSKAWIDTKVPPEYWLQHPEHGIGCNHKFSGTGTLDVDHAQWAALAFEEMGLDLGAILRQGIRSEGATGRAKAWFLIPAGLPVHKVVWPHPTERRENGKPVAVTVFELRGAGGQDVLPPSMHPEGHPYRWVDREAAARPLSQWPELPDELVRLWRDFDRNAWLNACPWYEPPEAKERLRKERKGAQGAGVIGPFNEAHSVQAMLERHGYKLDERTGKYCSPDSTTGTAGVWITPDGLRCYSHHGDELGDGESHDAFDVYRILDHDKDRTAAVREAAKALGMDAKPQEVVRDPVQEAEKLRYISVPTPPEGLYYGRLGVWTEQACANSEASPLAVFLGFAAYAGACFGRGPRLELSDTDHHPRLNVLHIGRTAKGRKGTAVAPVDRLHRLMKADYGATAPYWHDGGLATREGIAYAIRDPVYEENDEGETVEVDAGVPDKRMMVVESEFENVLQQGNRDGNTLSSAIRDLFDGKTLAPLTKTNRTKATDPHVAIVGHVTPHELLVLLKDRHVTNGFLNRWLIFWAERTRLVPFPASTPANQVRQWAEDLHAPIAWSREDREMSLSDEARGLYAKTYTDEWANPSPVPVVCALLERAPVVALRLAMIFAVMEQTRTISEKHLACAIAWTRYWKASVEYVWRDRVRLDSEETRETEIMSNARRVYAFVRDNGKTSRKALLHDCFQRHLAASELDAALEWMQLQIPPRIVVEEEPTGRARSGRQYTTTFVSIPEHGSHGSHDCDPCSGRASTHGSHGSHGSHRGFGEGELSTGEVELSTDGEAAI